MDCFFHKAKQVSSTCEEMHGHGVLRHLPPSSSAGETGEQTLRAKVRGVAGMLNSRCLASLGKAMEFSAPYR